MKLFVMGLVAVATFLGTGVQAKGKDSREHALIAYMRVQPGTETQFLAAAQQVITESRKEAGNIIYELHQSVVNPQQFVFYELFRTNADMQFHRNAPHVKHFLQETKPITLQFVLEEYTLKSQLE